MGPKQKTYDCCHYSLAQQTGESNEEKEAFSRIHDFSQNRNSISASEQENQTRCERQKKFIIENFIREKIKGVFCLLSHVDDDSHLCSFD